jgi:hypothetical protein
MTNKDEINSLNNNSDEKTSDEFLKQSNEMPLENDSSLDALVREQQSYVSNRLHKELGREPTQEEMNQWLHAHTEGY